jgi:phosphatidylglycerophosphate synthase
MEIQRTITNAAALGVIQINQTTLNQARNCSRRSCRSRAVLLAPVGMTSIVALTDLLDGYLAALGSRSIENPALQR